MATENPINTYPILAILSAIVHISIISDVVPPANPNKDASGFANISNTAVKINVTIRVSIIPYFIQSSTLFEFWFNIFRISVYFFI